MGEFGPGPDVDRDKMTSRRESLDNKHYEAWKKESGLREDIQAKLITFLEEPIVADKKSLNLEESEFPIAFGADDQIEIKAIDGEICIRNNSLQKPESESQNIEFQDASSEDLGNFADMVDENKIGAHRIQKYARVLDDGSFTSNGYRGYKLVDNGEMVGYAVVVESGNHAYLESMAVNPDSFGQGYGAKILDGLKKEYSSMRVSASPFDKEQDRETALQRLRAFYRSNGFINGNWSRFTPSLEDKSLAGEWIRVNDHISIGMGQHNVFKEDMIRAIIKSYEQDKERFDALPEELKQQIRDWNSSHSEMVSARKELEELRSN